MDRTLAMISMDVLRQDVRAISKLPPVIQKAHEIISQYQQASQPMDPAMVQRERNQIQAKDNEQKNQLKAAELEQRKQAANMTVVQGREKLQADLAKEGMRAKTQKEIAAADSLAESSRLQLKEVGESRRTAETNQTKLEINADDNMTALSIAKAEIENDEKTDLSTGDGINPGTG